VFIAAGSIRGVPSRLAEPRVISTSSATGSQSNPLRQRFDQAGSFGWHFPRSERSDARSAIRFVFTAPML